jgi:putative flippase GtrA
LIIKFINKNKEIFIYFLVGLINNVFNYAIYLLVLFLTSIPLVSGFFGFCVGLISNFFLNRKFTFKIKVSFKEKFSKYTFVQLFILFIQLLFLKLFLIVGLYEEFAQIPAILISGILNYIILKLYIFNK